MFSEIYSAGHIDVFLMRKGYVGNMFYFDEPEVDVLVFENVSDIADGLSSPEIPDLPGLGDW